MNTVKLQRLLRVEAAVVRVERLCGALLVAQILIVTVTQVAARYGFGSPFSWAGELGRYSLVWLTFAAATAALASTDHIQVDVLQRRLPDRVDRWLTVGVHLVVLAACLALVPASWEFVQSGRGVHTPGLGLSLFWVYGIVLLAFCAMALHTVLRVMALLARVDDPTTADSSRAGGV